MAKQRDLTIQELVEYDNILLGDGLTRKACLHGLSRKYAGQVVSSDVIGKARKMVYLWLLVIKKKSKRQMDTRKI